MSSFINRLLFVVILFIICSCQTSQNHSSIDLDKTEWKIYRNRNIGFEFKFPGFFTYDIKDKGHHVFLKNDSVNSIIVRYVTEAEGKTKGLWFGNSPKESVTYNGHMWQKFIYKHRDGTIVSRTVSFVTPLKDRFLGIEFRTKIANDEFQNYVMNSLQLLEPDSVQNLISR